MYTSIKLNAFIVDPHFTAFHFMRIRYYLLLLLLVSNLISLYTFNMLVRNCIYYDHKVNIKITIFYIFICFEWLDPFQIFRFLVKSIKCVLYTICVRKFILLNVRRFIIVSTFWKRFLFTQIVKFNFKRKSCHQCPLHHKGISSHMYPQINNV